MYMVLEQLRYTLSNLDSSNFNETGLAEITSEVEESISWLTQTAEDITARVKNAEGDISILTQTAEEIEARVESTEGDISTLTQTAEKIEARVENAEGNISTLTQTAEDITARVESAEGDISTLTQTASSLESRISDAEGNINTVEQTLEGVAFTSSLADGSTVINGGCISTGQILASYIKLGGNLEIYKTADSDDVGGYLGFTTSANDGSEAMHMASSDGSNEVVVTDNGAALRCAWSTGDGTNGVYAVPNFCYVTANGTQYDFFAGSFSTSSGDITLGTGDRYWSAAYLTTVYGSLASSSDEGKKHDMAPVGEKYQKLFQNLAPCAYRYDSEGEAGPVHLGFTAQGVRRAMERAGLEEGDFA
ncbi:MAG: hypothetical protein LUE91_02660, partial [Oscillospiraceae bacterium]|nr:hypothetical protein [Oscillospiraceae bacterium]